MMLLTLLLFCPLLATAIFVLNTDKHDGIRPNVVLIMPDDLDLELGSLEYLPLLDKYITQHGTAFQRHYCTIALCCPSRVSLLTGKAAHNTVRPKFAARISF